MMLLLLTAAVVLSAAQSASVSPAASSASPATSPTSPPASTTSNGAIPFSPAAASSSPSPAQSTASPAARCLPSLEHIKNVYSFTSTADFKALTYEQQILVFELLAAGEECLVREFITPDTADLIFQLVDSKRAGGRRKTLTRVGWFMSRFTVFLRNLQKVVMVGLVVVEPLCARVHHARHGGPYLPAGRW